MSSETFFPLLVEYTNLGQIHVEKNPAELLPGEPFKVLECKTNWKSGDEYTHHQMLKGYDDLPAFDGRD